jgi:hypothetical protein
MRSANYPNIQELFPNISRIGGGSANWRQFGGGRQIVGRNLNNSGNFSRISSNLTQIQGGENHQILVNIPKIQEKFNWRRSATS